jgi:hypothetical protein
MPIERRILPSGRLEFVNHASFSFSGRGGESIENAIVVKGDNGSRGMAFMATFDFLNSLFPRSRISSAPSERIGERQYDTFTITTYDGGEQRLFLDVTEVLVPPENVPASIHLRDEVAIEDNTDLRERTPDYIYLCFAGWPPPGPNGLQIVNRNLYYTPCDGNVEQRLDVSAEQWADIVSTCNELDIWSLPKDLSDSDIIDGLLYAFKFKCGSRVLQSEGQLSGYPSWKQKLLRVHRMLQDLTGWRMTA